MALVALFFLACSGKSSIKDFSETKKLVKIDSVTLVLDSKTSFEFQNVRYYNNDSIEWLVVLNQNIHGINIYDLKTGELESQFSVPTEGPEGMQALNGFTFVSPDSIFLFNKMSLSKIAIVDFRGDRVGTLSGNNVIIESDPYNLPVINHQSNTYSPTVKIGQKLYFTRWAFFDFSRPENISSDYPLEFSLDLQTFKLEEMPISFPKWMQNQGWNMMYLLNGKTLNSKGDFVYHFGGDDSVTTLYSNGEKKRYYAGLSGSKFNKEPIKSSGDQMRSVEEVMTTTIYWGLVYDKFRNVYYRIADRPITFRQTHKTLNDTYEKPISIVILDSAFNKIGEHDLPKDCYVFYGLFVGKNGLYIPRLNPKYSNFSEDLITYSIYQFNENL